MVRLLLPFEHKVLVCAGLVERSKVRRRSYTLKFKQEVILYHQRALEVIGVSASKHWTSSYFKRSLWHSSKMVSNPPFSHRFKHDRKAAWRRQFLNQALLSSKKWSLERSFEGSRETSLEKASLFRERGLRASACTICKWALHIARCESTLSYTCESLNIKMDFVLLRSSSKCSDIESSVVAARKIHVGLLSWTEDNLLNYDNLIN